jgi:hypothetical protein
VIGALEFSRAAWLKAFSGFHHLGLPHNPILAGPCLSVGETYWKSRCMASANDRRSSGVHERGARANVEWAFVQNRGLGPRTLATMIIDTHSAGLRIIVGRDRADTIYSTNISNRNNLAACFWLLHYL